MNDILEHRTLVEKYLRTEAQDLSAFSFVNVFAWKDFFSFDLKAIDGKLCVFAANETGRFLYLPPLGKGINAGIIEKCFAEMEAVNKGNGVSRIENIHEGQLDLFPKDEFVIFEKGRDYYYEREGIAACRGGAYKSKRSSYNYFVKHFKTRYCPFDGSMTDGCLALYDVWSEERRVKHGGGIYSQMLSENRSVHERVMRHYEVLGMEGRVVLIDGEVKAYTFGVELVPDVFCVFLETADLTRKGLPVFIFRQFCGDDRLRRYRYINVMDDFELDNIRRTKVSFRPAFTKPLFTVRKKDAVKIKG